LSIKRIAVLTSGGDAPGMNAAIRAVTRKALYHNLEVIGIHRGYQGLITEDFSPMNVSSVAAIINKGGTALKTARCEQFKNQEGFSKAVQFVRKCNIDAIAVIGGDGSMTGAQKLSEAGIPTVVIPATIDNDMPGTEYALGFDTALNTILEAVNKIRDTSLSHDRVAIIEVMGRHAGQLALYAGISCGAEHILIPEIPVEIDNVCRGLVRSKERGKMFSIIMVAEGAGRGYEIAAQIAERIPLSSNVTILGHIQRGGNPTAKDNIIASCMGAVAVDSIVAGHYNCLISQQQGNIITLPYEEAFKMKREIDKDIYIMAGILAQ